MQSSKAIIASAGSGKTTRLVSEALASDHKSLIVTYTIENYEEIQKKIISKAGFIPKRITVMTWFSFLLQDGVRPYKNFVFERLPRVQNIEFISGRSAAFAPKDTLRYFFSNRTCIYTDKIGRFVILSDEKSDGKVVKRLKQLYDHIYIDEVQDMAGYDLDLLEHLLSSGIKLTMSGDIRQTVYTTNNSAKNSKYNGKLHKLFNEWIKEKLPLEVITHPTTYRSNQAICDFADKLNPDLESSISKNDIKTGHDGIFLIKEEDAEKYIQTHKPMVLKATKNSKTFGGVSINFGKAKGMTYDRVLISPTEPIKKFLTTGEIEHIKPTSKAKLYVAITRARFSVAFVHKGNIGHEGLDYYSLS
jgi:DNA helicase-2/ATP-dependent DNA helicase PcrA